MNLRKDHYRDKRKPNVGMPLVGEVRAGCPAALSLCAASSGVDKHVDTRKHVNCVSESHHSAGVPNPLHLASANGGELPE